MWDAVDTKVKKAYTDLKDLLGCCEISTNKATIKIEYDKYNSRKYRVCWEALWIANIGWIAGGLSKKNFAEYRGI